MHPWPVFRELSGLQYTSLLCQVLVLVIGVTLFVS